MTSNDDLVIPLLETANIDLRRLVNGEKYRKHSLSLRADTCQSGRLTILNSFAMVKFVRRFWAECVLFGALS